MTNYCYGVESVILKITRADGTTEELPASIAYDDHGWGLFSPVPETLDLRNGDFLEYQVKWKT